MKQEYYITAINQTSMPNTDKQVPNSFDLINNHLSDYFDSEEILVMHEKESEVVHSDVYIVKPSEDRDYYILLSSGMSALPMKVPEGHSYLAYAEVMMLLPANWNMNYDDFADENNYWPIRTLQQLSKYPHLNDTWFDWGHTVPLDSTHPVCHRFTSVMLLNSLTLSDEFTMIAAKDKPVMVYSIIPLYKEELDYAIAEGTGKLMERFEKFDIDEIVDVNRVNTCHS